MSEMPAGDPHIENILEGVPENVARDLTPDQWEGFREALRKMRDNPRNVVEIRFVLPLYFLRLYSVFIFGKDTRERVEHVLIERRKRALGVVGAAILALAFVGLVAVALVLLYIIKTLCGLDIFQDSHIGDWLS